MAVTLKDVAAAAGVSRSTASRALSGSPLIAPETRTAVENAARRLGYRPNRAASALRSRRSKLIGLVMNNLINASFHTIAGVVQRCAADEGYQVILCITDAEEAREESVLRMLAEHNVDGVLVIGTGKNAATCDEMLDAGTAVVNVIRAPDDGRAPSVLASDREGAYAATRHLLELGHRRIGYLGGLPSANSGRERYAGYEEALREHGLEADPVLLERGPFSPAFGAEATRRLLERAPDMTALFGANHEAVFGVLPTLASAGIRVPDRLSLVCHEDIHWLANWQPPITVVDNGAAELGRLAFDLLMQQIRGTLSTADSPGLTYRIGARLITRASCAPPTWPAPGTEPPHAMCHTAGTGEVGSP
ncbi:LacI family DNA-binding transcriptional regulator [Thermobifida halotolerans]|uniref:LacI family DNA-binding transcriptional regulator n=1 Tax=Thermobifida halotolerans TaxID=483545 RepID=A0AA97LY56_9ACTN|nr:LacI family DNA-binding transcriptional regulator [Thermobifida halotolerans]UOE20362.1 LacI family DNA-binding transcriptional regulator [Thermobifida halotolerans]